MPNINLNTISLTELYSKVVKLPNKVEAPAAGGGNTNAEDGLVEGTLTTYSNSRVTKVRSYGFYQNADLVEVDLPNVQSIGTSAFTSCSKLTTVNLPALKTTGTNAFAYCQSLTDIDIPLVQAIEANTFTSCAKLVSVNAPKATTTGSYAFRQCSALKTVNLDSLSVVGTRAFSGCTSLSQISLPKVTSISGYAFQGCTSLKTLHLMGSSIASLTASTVFSNTGIKSTAGSIYVPFSLASAYKAATNWTYFSTQIIGVGEPEPVENTFSINGVSYQINENNQTWLNWMYSNGSVLALKSSTGKIQAPLTDGTYYDLYDESGNIVATGDKIIPGGSYTTSTFEFTIEGTSYHADRDMTWAQWMDSSYNTDGYDVLWDDDTGIGIMDEDTNSVHTVYYENSTPVSISEKIVPGYAYRLV